MDAHSWMCRGPEIPTLEVARADLGDRLDAGCARPVCHPDCGLARRRVAQSDLGAAIPEEAEAVERGIRRDQVVGALRHLLQGRHLALGDGGPDLHPRLEVLRTLPFLLLADHLLDLGPQPAQRLLQGRHLSHDFPDPAGQLVVGGLIEAHMVCHRHTIIGQRVSSSSVDRPVEGCDRRSGRRAAAGARTDWS